RLVLHIFPKDVRASDAFQPLPSAKVQDLLTQGPALERISASADLSLLEAAAGEVSAVIGRSVPLLTLSPSLDAETLLITLGADASLHKAVTSSTGTSLLSLAVYRPLPTAALLQHVPASANKVVVLEPTIKRTTKWTPLFLDVVAALQEREPKLDIYSATLGIIDDATAGPALATLIDSLGPVPVDAPLVLGNIAAADQSTTSNVPSIPKHEASYTKILNHLFNDRLEIVNDPALVPELGDVALRPEYALGRARAAKEDRDQLEQAIKELLEAEGSSTEVSRDLHNLLAKWLANKDDSALSRFTGDEIVKLLESHPPAHPSTDRILALRRHLPLVSRWIIGSDAWSYDLGASGLHHLIASSLNVNILLLDNIPYTTRNAADPSKRKKDAGLYAMNHGDAFVASIAVYSSYSQSLHALLEADQYKGPSVVLAYLPYDSEDATPLSVLKETKLAVDMGYWPLYRWNPLHEDDPFTLESDAVKADLQEFLDRQNHLSQLVRSKPEIAAELVSSLGQQLQDARKERAKQAYSDLLNAMEGPPLLVLYASDGGTAEKFAKRLVTRAKARGVAARLAVMDSVPLDELKTEEN
ncbi:hypothetical protein FRB99_004090, partial [Tulasnella sp. 403]